MHPPDLEATRIYLELLSHRSRDVAVGFVYTELVTGLSSCRLVRESTIIKKRMKAWHLNYAETVLQHAEAGMWKLKLSHPEFDQMMALAERLRFELDALQ
jgi:hypothetical protein